MVKIGLGSTVKDRITGLKGVVMARAEYLTGCVHVAILATKVDKEGKVPEYEWIDETRCILDKTKKIIKLVEKDTKAPGGSMPNAPKM